VRGGGVEVAAAGVLDACVVGHGSCFGATCDLNAFGWRHRVHIVKVEVLIFFDLSKLVGFGQTREGIFAGDLCQGDGAID
jgi:hypothetical protein